MFKKTLSIAASTALLFTLALPITPNAHAYRDVCVRFELPKVWYVGRFRVEYGDPDELRSALFLNARLSTFKAGIGYWERSGHLARARARTNWSPQLSTNQHHCMSIDDVRHNEHFTVLVRTEFGDAVTLRYCREWTPGKPLIFQQDASDQSRLMIKAWGTVTEPECAAEWRR